MGDEGGAAIKRDFMTKRSQMKGKLRRENYKSRWFVLRKFTLSYHDGSFEDGKEGRQRGMIKLKNVKAVEHVEPKHLGNRPHSFQIMYQEDGKEGLTYVLYIIAVTHEMRDDWIHALVETCTKTAGAEFSTTYHPGVWKREGFYSCCEKITKNSDGCHPTTNSPMPASPTFNGTSHTAVTVPLGSPGDFSSRTLPPTPPTHSPLGSAQPEPTMVGVSHSSSTGLVAQLHQTLNITPEKLRPTPRSTSPSPRQRRPLPNKPDPPSTLPKPTSTVVNLTKAPPTPPSNMKRVIALHDYFKQQKEDLDLIKGEQYDILEMIEVHWLKARDKEGAEGFIPANYVEEITAQGLEQYNWYYPDTSRAQSEEILREEAKEGCFLVRNSSQRGMYTLSIYARESGDFVVKHYHIKKNDEGLFYLQERHAFGKIHELVHYHKHNSAGLIVRLRCSPADRGNKQPATSGLGHGMKEIDPKELTLLEDLGSGQFGVVKLARWRGQKDVAVKMCRDATAVSADEFIEEAKTMVKLKHPNLVQLYGVCNTDTGSIYIVTEYMKNGALLTYLRRRKPRLLNDPDSLLDICYQVCCAMAYLEGQSFIHRDLAARNCLVGADLKVKVADFGLARFVLDDEYTSSQGTKFPIRWAPPEVLTYTRFSTKSDVWSFGVMMWEVYTCGEMPYGNGVRNQEVVERVCNQSRLLNRPRSCSEEVYAVMKECWKYTAKDRPSFSSLESKMEQFSTRLEYAS